MTAQKTLLVIAALVVGCASGSNGDTQYPDAFETSADLNEGSEVAMGLEVVPDDSYSTKNISGSWASLQVVSTIANAPVIGNVGTLSIALVRWEIEQVDDGSIAVEQDACQLALESDSEFVKMLIPEPFVDSIVTYQKPGTIDLSVDPPVLNIPMHAEVHGAVLTDDMNDEMPTSADDPRVVDADGDGKPGLSVYVSGIIDGALYVVQRNLTSINGVVFAPDHMEGLMGFAQEQNVLGSDNPLLADNPPTSSVDPDPDASYFIARRIPASWDCATIVINQEELFGADAP